MLKINSAIIFVVFLCANLSLYSSQGQDDDDISLAEIDAGLERIEREDSVIEIFDSYESEFKKSCRSLGLDESSITPAAFQKAYFQAIAKRDIDPALSCLPWDQYVRQYPIIILYKDIDFARSYFAGFFTKQKKLITRLKAAQRKKDDGTEISTEDEIMLLNAIKDTPPEALALIEDDVFRFLSSEYVDYLTEGQLCMLSKSQIKIITDDSRILEKLIFWQKKVLEFNPEYVELKGAAAAAQSQ